MPEAETLRARARAFGRVGVLYWCNLASGGGEVEEQEQEPGQEGGCKVSRRGHVTKPSPLPLDARHVFSYLVSSRGDRTESHLVSFILSYFGLFADMSSDTLPFMNG